MNIAQFWDFCTKLKWNDIFLDELEQFFKVHSVRRILDCAGGTGFPVLELKQRGWDVTYSDGSQDMHDFFVSRLRKYKLRIPHRVVNWSRLSAEFEPDFDAVLCRGNALVYINTWDVDRFPGESRDDIENSLKQFFAVLRPGGLVYVDANFALGECNGQTYVEAFPETIIDGKRVNLTWEITLDRANR
jgi:SAM-dependent methyltransferase